MKALFLTDLEARILIKILRASIVNTPGGKPGWLRQSAAGKEHNYTHGKLMQLAVRVIRKQGNAEDGEPDPFEEEKERRLCVKRERMAAIRMAKRALDI